MTSAPKGKGVHPKADDCIYKFQFCDMDGGGVKYLNILKMSFMDGPAEGGCHSHSRPEYKSLF